MMVQALFSAVTWQAALSTSDVSQHQQKMTGLKFPKHVDFLTARPSSLALVDVDHTSQTLFDKAIVAGSADIVMSVVPNSDALFLRPAKELHKDHIPVAWAHYNNTMNQNGWTYLSVSSSPSEAISTEMKMYAAGFLEGFITAKQIRDFQHNAGILMQEDEQKHHAMANIQSLFDRQLHTITDRGQMVNRSVLTAENAPSDPWWRQARFAMLQSWGTLDAYNFQVDKVSGRPMSMVDLMVLNSDGETPELEMAYDMEESLLRQSEHDSPDDDKQSFLQRRTVVTTQAIARTQRKRTREQELRQLDDRAWRRIKDSTGHCSALVRVTEGNQDLMIGHTTFSDYTEMNRIFKYYDLPVGDGTAQKMGFSSYPGVAGSTDDYYLMDSGLVVTETTISMLTDEPYDRLTDNTGKVPDFMRIMLANRLARNGKDWTEWMRKSSTGTYCSQWMVVDYNKFTAGQELQNGTLWVVEQVPGMNHIEDMTYRLRKQGFWASENRPWFKDVRDNIGATEAEEIHGSLFSAEKNPRARIFGATAPKVQTLADMGNELQRNKWPHEIDGGDRNTPDHAISARGDLDKASPNPNGGVDSKITNACLAKKLQCDAISGPTHVSQTPFRWTDEKGKELFPGVPHDGEPNVWNFDWVRMTPGGEAAAGQTC